MTNLALLLLLQITYRPDDLLTFNGHVAYAQRALNISSVPVVLDMSKPWPSWVDQGPGAAWQIYVRRDFLWQADPLALRSVAYHETCHLYLGNSRRRYVPGEEALVHLMIAGCVEWLHGPDFHRAMTAMPCQKWYPYEATRYNRLIGKERCRAKR